MAFGPQEAIDNAAILSSGVAGAEALGMRDLPPFLKLLTYALVATSIISHILKSDHGANQQQNNPNIQLNIGGDEYDGTRLDE